MSVEHVDVLVVTALQLERRAARAHLRDVQTRIVSGLAVDMGWHDGDVRRRVAIIETGVGNVDAAVLTARAEDAFRPAVIAMVGIAGGVKDVTVGDVVAASKVYWIEAGRQGSAFHPRPEVAAASPGLVQVARSVAAGDRWLSGPAAVVAPIVVAEKVLTHRGSDMVALIQYWYSDAVAVDMEDFGTLRAGRCTERARVIAVRGISDLIDGKAAADAAGSQQLAAANAAAFLFEMLTRSDSPRHGQRNAWWRPFPVSAVWAATISAAVLVIACGRRVATWRASTRSARRR